ncbi:TPA: hypothetical protein JD656_RS16365 [Morganella morganii]|nr:hypothetical protein [Morganella morganii]
MLSKYCWFVAWECTVQGRVARNSAVWGTNSNEPDEAFAELVKRIEQLGGVVPGSVLITGFNRL